MIPGKTREPVRSTSGSGPRVRPVDHALRWKEVGEDDAGAPAQDEEFVRSHCDNIQTTGFLEHIRLPHHVDFQAELELVRRLRRGAIATECSVSTGDAA